MKKLFLLAGLFIFISSPSFAQAFGKGTKFVDAGFGIGIQHYRFTDLTNNSIGNRDTSGAFEIPFGFEYGILPWLGASINGNYAHYINGDSASNQQVNGIDFIPTLNIHAPFQLNKLDLFGSMGYGYSHFSYIVNNANGGKAIASGTVFNWGINLRWLFKTDGHLGMNFWYRHSNYLYKKGIVTDNHGNKTDFKLDGPGNNFGIGFFFRIAN